VSGTAIWQLMKGALAGMFGWLGFVSARRLGAEIAKREAAERRENDALEIVERLSRPIQTQSQRRADARAELLRRRNLRNSAGHH
jgi:hypothetical protein|tara:strand:+ start:3133 stop:3387 length:255 start_codon:yes stop_codon:yes gene_type:complete